MRKFLLATVAAATIASPAFAQDATGGYVGIEGGLVSPKSQNGSFAATFTQTTQVPAVGTTAPLPGTGLVGALPGSLAVPGPIAGGARVKWKRGYDTDLIGGYDFGMFRLEGELGYKRSKLKRFTQDTAFGSAIDSALNPVGTTGPAFVFPVDDETAFGLNNHVSVLSGMINGLFDFGVGGIGAYVGGGVGRARVKELGDRDSAWAWQGIAGVRFPISSNVQLGLKYRYFRTGHLNFDAPSTAFTSSTLTALVPNTGVGATGSTPVTFTRTAAVTGGFDDHFASHSLLASLIFSFGSVAEALPPPPPPPPPVVAPATQTCPDGSVIDATSACPPPPPPPPPAPVERGERGR